MVSSALPLSSSSTAAESQPEALATLLKAVGDPLRLQILRVLSHDAFGALELSDIFAMRQNAMSHHLKLLAATALVSSRREGTHVFYRRSPRQNHYPELCDALFHTVNQIVLPPEVQQRVNAIHDLRAHKSQAFFRANADKFRKQQDLIASYPQYGEAVLSAIDNGLSSRGLTQQQLVLEVGSGEGELLPGLHTRFKQVVALDNAAEMLARAQRSANKLALSNVRFILGNTACPELGTLAADAITLNMVLHHTPAPAAIIQDLAAYLQADGILFITELCHHDQDWVREACGDLWLGFEPEEINQWATNAGLVNIGSEFLALKNGFSIQISQFRQAPTLLGLPSVNNSNNTTPAHHVAPHSTLGVSL